MAGCTCSPVTAPPGLMYPSIASKSPPDSSVPTRTTTRSPVTGFSITSPALLMVSSLRDVLPRSLVPLPRPPVHVPVADAQHFILARHLETELFVEADVDGLVGLQVGVLRRFIHLLAEGSHEHRANAPPLKVGVYGHGPEMPVTLVGIVLRPSSEPTHRASGDPRTEREQGGQEAELPSQPRLAPARRHHAAHPMDRTVGHPCGQHVAVTAGHLSSSHRAEEAQKPPVAHIGILPESSDDDGVVAHSAHHAPDRLFD